MRALPYLRPRARRSTSSSARTHVPNSVATLPSPFANSPSAGRPGSLLSRSETLPRHLGSSRSSAHNTASGPARQLEPSSFVGGEHMSRARPLTSIADPAPPRTSSARCPARARKPSRSPRNLAPSPIAVSSPCLGRPGSSHRNTIRRRPSVRAGCDRHGRAGVPRPARR